MEPFVLRPWREEDARDVAAAANNPRVAANLRNAFPSPYTLADAAWYVGDCIARGGAADAGHCHRREGQHWRLCIVKTLENRYAIFRAGSARRRMKCAMF